MMDARRQLATAARGRPRRTFDPHILLELAARLAAGESQEAAGRALGLSQPTVSRIVRTPEFAQRLAASPTDTPEFAQLLAARVAATRRKRQRLATRTTCAHTPQRAQPAAGDSEQAATIDSNLTDELAHLPPLMTLQEVADATRAPWASVKFWIHCRRLPSIKVGKRVLVSRTDLVQFLADHRRVALAGGGQPR